MSGVAFLSNGRLYVKEGDEAPRPFDSKFAQSIRDRAVRSAQKNAWKQEGTGAQFMRGGALWGAAGRDTSVMRIAITGLSRAAQPGLLLYALDTDDIVGLFSLDPATGEEKRLFHSNDRRVRFPSARPDQPYVVCSVLAEGGTSNLAVMNADGSDLREITEGESMDLAPSWAPASEGQKLVYQTAGLGRDREGRIAGMSPFSIQRLDLQTGEIEPLLEDPKHDFLGPKVAPDGTIYAIRRPYRAAGSGVSPWRAAADVALFPVRMVGAVFGFLNIFSMRYSGKPLSTSGGAKQKEADPRQMMIWGNLIDAERAAEKAKARGEAAPSLVPASWTLVRKRLGRAVEEVASGILSFDVGAEGTVVCANGSVVDVVGADGKRETLSKGELIEQVIALDAT
jgi:hypothetical protein